MKLWRKPAFWQPLLAFAKQRLVLFSTETARAGAQNFDGGKEHVLRNGRKKRRMYYMLYTLLFAGMAAICFGVFIRNGKSLIWRMDGLRQHYIALLYIGRWGREILQNLFFRHVFEIPLWDFHIGYGSDILTTLHYYGIGDPLNLLSVLTPSACTETLYGALVVLRLYLAGAAFSFYCLEKDKRWSATLAGALQYVFCGYAAYAALRHPFFINPMIYLPLLFVGADRIFQRKKPTLFLFMVFLSAISNFYFFYMIAFAVCFYVLVRFFTLQHARLGRELLSCILTFFGYACVGVAMSAVILLPVLLQFFGTNRAGVTILHEPVYEVDYYKAFIAGFLMPDAIDKWTFLGFTAPALLALFVLFGERRRHAGLWAAFLILTAMLWIPFFGKALNGFSYVSNRWCFLYAALISFVLVEVWEEMALLTRRASVCAAVFGGTYVVYMCRFSESETEGILGAIVLAVALLPYVTERFFRPDRRVRLASALLLCATLLHIGVNWYGQSGGGGKNRIADCVDAGTALLSVGNSAPYAVRQAVSPEEGFFRFEMDDFDIVNSSALAGVNGIQYYWSLENAAISDYLADLAPNRYRPFNYRDLDQRTFPGALAGVKYCVQKNSDVAPYGYRPADMQTGPYAFYENLYALPLGYTYGAYMTRDAYQKMTPAQRQEALMQGILLEKEGEAFVKGYPKEEPKFSSQPVAYEVVCKKNVTRQSDGSFQVDGRKGKIRLDFQGLAGCETYLFLQGVDMDTGNLDDSEFGVQISSDATNNSMRYNTDYHKYSIGQKDFLINLGYQEAAQSSIHITFPKEGTYRFENMEVICQPMGQYAGWIEALRRYRLEGEEVRSNTVKGSISLPEDRILCLSIPYSKGWRAWVDGGEQPLLRANGMYMALPLTKGTHTIKLSYRTPGLGMGAGISLAGFLSAGALLRKRKRKNEKRREFSNVFKNVS